MLKDEIQQTYEKLLILGCVKSRSDFSSRWLGMDESYYRSVLARNEKISVRAQVHLVACLRDRGTNMAFSEYEFMVPKGHILIDLHSRLLEGLFERVTCEALGFPQK